MAQLFLDSNHVFRLGIHTSPDMDVWEYARKNDFVIVSKDADFNEIIAIRGFPPKLIWLRTENCTTTQIEALLRSRIDAIEEMNKDTNIGVLSLL